jgi:hypothetical protein
MGTISRIVSIDLESASYVEIQKVIDLLTKELGTPEVNRWENVKRRRFSDEKITEIEKRADQDLGAFDPGEGYRLLADDEVIQKGDEYWTTSCKVWDYTTCPGSTPEKQRCVYRRKIETKETSKSDLQSRLWAKIRSFEYHGDAVTWVRRQTDCSFASAGNFVTYVRKRKAGPVPYLTVGTDHFSWSCFNWNL